MPAFKLSAITSTMSVFRLAFTAILLFQRVGLSLGPTRWPSLFLANVLAHVLAHVLDNVLAHRLDHVLAHEVAGRMATHAAVRV